MLPLRFKPDAGAFEHRMIAVCQGADDAVEMLEKLDSRQLTLQSVREPENVRSSSCFPEQGAQYANMGRELYEVEGVFRQHIDLCAEILELSPRL